MTTVRTHRWPRWWRRVQVTSRRANFFAAMWVVAIVTFLAMSVITWRVVASQTAGSSVLPSDLVAALLIGTLVPAMAILILLGRRLALQRAAAHGGGAGHLHVKLVFFFSLISAIPTLLVVIFASWLFQYGVEFWFSDSSRGLLQDSNKLARGYYEQAQRDMEYESLAMAGDLRDFLVKEPLGSPAFPDYYFYQVKHRKLDQSNILRKGANGALETAAFLRDENPLSAEVSTDVLRKLDGGQQIVISAQADRIEAVTPIDRRAGLYLYTLRKSDLLALSQGKRALDIVRAYDVLTRNTRILQLQANIALFIASLVMVALSIWFALRFADRQVQPLYGLVAAAREVGAGNFAMRVEGRTGADEIGLLNRAFNRMTRQLDRQTQALIGANQQLDERREFIEAVLESVASGVISIAPDGRILLMNSSAQKLLLEWDQDLLDGMLLADVAPPLAMMLEEGRTDAIVQYAKGTDLLTLAVKATREHASSVITFEDITRRLVDQRQAAWSDVARRIAHEIKNPLTPIQLATERLRRRYRKQIVTDGALFDELTSTIVRQVGDLRKMVDEFSSFARLPKPVFRREDLVDLARQALFLQEVAHAGIDFRFTADSGVGMIACDRHQFGQAMTNVLKNAVEAIESKQKLLLDDNYRGQITVHIASAPQDITVSVTDNGVGLPQDRDRIVEPYVTTREKGTGLGLAIVNKIVEEHGGEMAFAVAEGGGSTVTMRFSRDPRSEPVAGPELSSNSAG